MARYIAQRVLLGVVVIIGVVLLTFAIARLVPGDPAAIYAGPHATASAIAKVRKQLGLDRPLAAQIYSYAKGVFQGNWGTSLRTHRSVLSDIEVALPPTVELVAAGLLIAALVGLPMGVLSARWKGKLPDLLARLVSVVAVSMPVFWLALILQMVFAQKLGILPVGGEYDPNLYYTHPLTQFVHMPLIDSIITGNFAVFASSVSHLILPALAIAAYPMGLMARMVRASILDTLGEEHIRMTRALGYRERSIFLRFAMKPSLNPIVQVAALVFAYSLANTFLVEAVFDWPGLGSYAVNSLQALDTPSIIGVTLVVAIVYVVLNLAVDLIQAALDPRIRIQ
jgi:peptide/nickel transport system permease protein